MRRIAVRPLYREVADQLRELIRKGKLQTGQRVREELICRQFGISRTPLREALRVLSTEGLIELVPHRGAFVTQPTMDEIREMFVVMGALEGLCARIAAARMDDADLARLERLHDRLEQAYAGRDAEAYIQANKSYHEFVQQMADNRTLNDIVNGLRHKIFLYRYQQLHQPARFDQSILEHRRLLDAFRRKDVSEAERLMAEHLARQCEALVSLYEEAVGTKGETGSRASPGIGN